MINIYKESQIKMIPTKEEVIQRVNNLIKKYGRRVAGKTLRDSFLSSGDWYQDDRRESPIKFVLDIINNIYSDKELPIYYSDYSDYYRGRGEEMLIDLADRDNCIEIIDALSNAEEELERMHRDI